MGKARHRKPQPRIGAQAAVGTAIAATALAGTAQAANASSAGQTRGPGVTASAAADPTDFTGQAFDTCTTPSEDQMADLKQSAANPQGFTGAGIYLGWAAGQIPGGCGNQSLTAQWVSDESAAGWKFIPIYVGVQSYTAGFATGAAADGTADAQAAAAEARSLGLPSGAALYADIDGSYAASLSPAVWSYASAWTTELHALGYRSGVYGDGNDAITTLVQHYGAAGTPDDVDVADWGHAPNSVADTYIPAGDWADSQRIIQYNGNQTVSVGGETMYIDEDYAQVGPAHTIRRLAGSNAIGTAVAISQSHWKTTASSSDTRAQAQAVVLTRSDYYADGLAGSPLAAAVKAPMLMTAPSAMNPTTLAEIERVLPKGGTVYLLGGTSALTPAVQSALTSAGYHTVRVAGSNQYGTAIAIAQQMTSNPTRIMVATATNYYDALSAGAAAGSAGNTVIMLSAEDALPGEVEAYIKQYPGASVYGVGGPGYTALKAAGISAHEVVGSDAAATATAVAATFYPGATTAGLATMTTYQDALTGGALLATESSPILLTQSTGLDPATGQYLSANAAGLGTFDVFGGTSALPPAVVDQAAADLATAGEVTIE